MPLPALHCGVPLQGRKFWERRDCAWPSPGEGREGQGGFRPPAQASREKPLRAEPGFATPVALSQGSGAESGGRPSAPVGPGGHTSPQTGHALSCQLGCHLPLHTVPCLPGRPSPGGSVTPPQGFRPPAGGRSGGVGSSKDKATR